MEQTSDEVKRLKACLNDLIAVLALPALWSGGESFQIVDTLLDVLLNMLRLDFAYAQLKAPHGGAPIEMVRLAPSDSLLARPQEIGQALKPWLGDGLRTWPLLVRNPTRDGNVSIAPLRLGLQHEIGWLVAASRRIDFPTETERLLLSVATNQAAIGLQESRLLSEQRRVSEALDQKVAQRTAELRAANEELKQEIAERKNAEEKLRRSEAFLAEAQRISHTGSWSWSQSTGKLTWSAEQYRILEFDPKETEPSFDLFWERIHSEDRALVRQAFDNVIHEGGSSTLEFRIVLPNGKTKHIYAVSHPVTKAADDNNDFVGTIMDITEQQQAKAALETALAEIEKSEDQQRLVIDTMPGLVWSTLSDGQADFINQRWLDYTGLSLKEALSSGWRVAIHPDDRSILDGWKASLAAGESFEAEARLRRFDGQYCWFLIRSVLQRDEEGNIVKCYGTNIDIEDRKRAETETGRLAALVEKAEDFIGIAGLNMNVLYVNAAGRKLVGLEGLNEVRATKRTDYFFPEDREFVEQVITPAVLEKGSWYGELRLRHFKTGMAIPVIYNSFRIDDPKSGAPINFGTVARDVTERRQAEEALRKAQAELAHLTRVATLGELTAAIAHEINQPLAAVVNNASACLRWLAAANLEEARQSAACVVADGHRAGEIISRIRALAKKAPPQKDWLNLNATILEVLALARSEVQKNHVSLRTQLSNDVPLIRGDRVEIQQVILNLIMNAIEAINGISEGPRELWVSSEKVESPDILITVRDSGPGLDPKSLDRLFDTFYTTKPQGMGMGLAISRSIVEAHGGRLWATANVPHGAIFQLILPIGGKRAV